MNSNREIIERFAKEVSLPSWWLEHLIIEYLPCRRYFESTEIWSFDFSEIKSSQIESILANKITIPASTTIFHNISHKTFSENVLKRMVGLPTEPINKDIIVEGKAGSDYFPVVFNSHEVWDPKLTFNNYCIVLDEDNFYQWKVAEFHAIEGATRGWFKSDIVNLSLLKEINERIQVLRDKRIQDKNVDIEYLREQAEYAYLDLERCRVSIREKLLSYHESKKRGG